MEHRAWIGLVAAFAALPGASCFGPLDVLGVETSTTEESTNRTEPQDDRIEDKHPEYDATRIVTETFAGGCRAALNKSAAVAKLDVAPLKGADAALKDLVFADRTAAATHVDDIAAPGADLIPSMETVNGALKPFNDGLYAAIELGEEEAVKSLLHDMLAALLALRGGATPAEATFIDAAAADMGAGLILGGEDPGLPADLLPQAQALVAEFDADPLFAGPTGFYTWSPELEAIFRQDRFLQNNQVERRVPGGDDPYSDAEVGKAAALAVVLQADPDLLDRYQGYLAIYAGLTNPFANLPVTALLPYVDGIAALDDPGALATRLLADHPPPPVLTNACKPHLALFPMSRSKETTYYESQWCDTGVPDGVDVMDALIQAIQDGLIDLQPSADSGWYDYQSWALETLLLPERGAESQHLLLTAAYKKKLMDTFRSIMTQNRETHVRQLDMGEAAGVSAGPQEFDVYPLFPVEPFPTFYLRSARAYRFLGTYLEAVLDAGFLDAVHRVNEDGTRGLLTLAQELHRKAALLYGLHLVAADSVGMAPELLADELAEFPADECRFEASLWLTGWRSDADVARDPRVIVPVQADGAGHVIYWAVTGVRAIKAATAFVPGHEPRDIVAQGTADGGTCAFRSFVAHDYYLLVESFAEVRIRDDRAPPTREEFRALCDAHDTQAGIVAALEAL